MHELAVTESILKIALDYAERSGACRITDLHLVVGQLASIVDDSVRFYWDMISKGSMAEGAQLHFRRVAVKLRCLECEDDYSPGGEEMSCPRCGSIRVRILAGEEFQLEAIDVEDTHVKESKSDKPDPVGVAE